MGEEEQPVVYVNPKQYRRILIRREVRAKRGENTPKKEAEIKSTVRKYAHESRHMHALHRPRGPGGRFLAQPHKMKAVGRDEAALGAKEGQSSEASQTSNSSDLNSQAVPNLQHQVGFPMENHMGMVFDNPSGGYQNQQQAESISLDAFQLLTDGADASWI
ncbi:unnamed protein product [Calypogeia fissa]